MFSYRFVWSITSLADLSRKRERERLKIRRDPYYQRLAAGAYLGFRRGPDTWISRFRDRQGVQHYNALVQIPADDYDGAVKGALAWFAQMGAPVGIATRATVLEALNAYVGAMKQHGREKAAKAAASLIKTTVPATDPLATIALEDATRRDFEAWRDRLRQGIKVRSCNRYTRQIIAGLNYAHGELGYVGSPACWALKPLVDDAEEESAAVFLDADQRKALIGAADSNTAAFLQGLEATGARPGELALAKVSDFDGKSIRLASHKGKASKRRTRRTILDERGRTFFAAQAKDKLPSAWLFTEDGTTPWARHSWARQIRLAVTAANKELKGAARIPPNTTAYAFRHSRASELLQMFGIDPVTVATQLGTGLTMLQRHYHRFIEPAMAEKLSALKVAK